MSGVHSMMLATGAEPVALTAGTNGSLIGFHWSAGVGSINPSQAAIAGAPIRGIYDSSGSFNVLLDGSRAQNHFACIAINGVVRNTSSATFSLVGGPASLWSWSGAAAGLVSATTYPTDFY